MGKSANRVSCIEVPYEAIRHYEASVANLENSKGLTPARRRFAANVLDYACQVADCSESTENPILLYPDLLEYIRSQTGKRPARSTFIENMNDLVAEGAFSETTLSHAGSGGRAPRKFIAAALHNDWQSQSDLEAAPILDAHHVDRSRSVRTALRAMKRGNDAYVEAAHFDQKPLTDQLCSGVLDRAMRFHARETPPDNRITNVVRVKGVEVVVTATTQTGVGSELAMLSDQALIRTLITMIADAVNRRLEAQRLLNEAVVDDDPSGVEVADAPAGPGSHPIPNLFYIDVTEIASKMGYKTPSSSSTRALINKMLRRLYETDFRIKINETDPRKIQRLRSLFSLPGTSTNIRFITDLKSEAELMCNDNDVRSSSTAMRPGETDIEWAERVSDPYSEDELQRVRLWRLSIDSIVFERLLDAKSRRLFTAHDDIMRERKGLGHVLYNYVTGILGRTNRELINEQEREYDQSVRTLHDTLWPLRRYDRFEEHLVNLLKSKIADSNWDETLWFNEVAMYGYVFRLYRRREQGGDLWLRIFRDRNDPLTGDHSFHNQKILEG